MRQALEKADGIEVGVRRATLAALTCAVAVLGALAAASPALASLKQDLQRFSNCPYNNPKVVKCIYSTTPSGEFVIGKSTVPINKTVTIQAGLEALGVFAPATNGETLSKTPLQVPGGLVGIELPGNFTEVTATAELAGQAALTTSVELPLKVKLGNLALGSSCYIGSEAEPLSLHLVDHNAVVTTKDKGEILVLGGTLIDSTFAAPGANGCTLLPLVGDLAVDTKVGLPSPAGSNLASMNSTTEEVNASLVKAVLPLPDLGRCEKLEGVAKGKTLVFDGGYTNSGCTVESPGNSGKWEWITGPGTATKFTGAGKALTLETVGKTTVSCTASSAAGEYTGPKTQIVSLTLTGCHQGKGIACQSGATAGEIKTASLEGGMEFIKENEGTEIPIVGVDLKPASGTDLASFECGGKSVSVGGSVIAPITSVDKMLGSFKVKPSQSGGKQSPEEFEVGSKDTLTFNEGLGEEQAGLKTTETNTNEESLEIKAVA